jgi:putative ABC transport system permease protein
MIKHFLVIAWRNFTKRKIYSLINVLGLAIGMTCCLLITQFIMNELSYDRYHKDGHRIFRVIHAFRDAGSNVSLTHENFQVWGNAPVGPALQKEFPEIESLTQFTSPNTLLMQYGEQRFQQDNILFMDSSAFDVFSWKMLAGNPKTALREPGSIVLTESLATKLFGKENALGKDIRIENREYYRVTGVVEDVPHNSHFDFSALASMATFRNYRPEIFGWWGYVDFYTYFKAREGTTLASLNKKIPAFLKSHEEQKDYVLGFERLFDAYLHSPAARQPGVTGSLSNVYIFGVIALFILVIACINFMNLSTARSMERAREVGVRKVLGAQPTALMRQFLAESVLLSLFAVLFALSLARASQPFIAQLVGKAYSEDQFFSTGVIALVISAAILTGLLSGIYPAVFLSRFRAMQVLKASQSARVGGVSMRKVLVVFQFTLSMALIAGTGIVYSQLDHLRKHDLGFRQEQMLIIDFAGDSLVQRKVATAKTLLEQNPNVLSVASSRAVPGEFLPNAYTEIQAPTGEMKGMAPLLYEIDDDFIPDYGISMAAGRPYSKDFSTDTLQALVINEAAARMFGYNDPKEIVGKKFSQWGREGVVIGVVKDFNFRSLHQTVEPLALRFSEFYALNYLSVRVKAGNLNQTVDDLKKAWNGLFPHRPFLYTFLDESFNRHYQADMNFGRVFLLFAGLAVFIACLGLFGLATFTAEQRTKEIGIRKVLGSSVSGIVALMSRDFLKLVIVAIIVAVPLCWLAMNEWLKDFPYRVSISPWVFVKSGLIAVVVASATISWQSLRAALTNPINSLRDE